MGYRIVEIMPEIFLENIFKEYKNKYEPVGNGEFHNDFEEFVKVKDGLPKDAKFKEFRIKPRNTNVIELVFESNEWTEKNNFDYVDVTFESLTIEKSKVKKLKEDEA